MSRPVRAEQGERARALLEVMRLEGGAEVDLSESANAEHLERAAGRGPRNYGVVGAYARAYLVAIVVIGAAFGVFMLLRAT